MPVLPKPWLKKCASNIHPQNFIKARKHSFYGNIILIYMWVLIICFLLSRLSLLPYSKCCDHSFLFGFRCLLLYLTEATAQSVDLCSFCTIKWCNIPFFRSLKNLTTYYFLLRQILKKKEWQGIKPAFTMNRYIRRTALCRSNWRLLFHFDSSFHLWKEIKSHETHFVSRSPTDQKHTLNQEREKKGWTN